MTAQVDGGRAPVQGDAETGAVVWRVLEAYIDEVPQGLADRLGDWVEHHITAACAGAGPLRWQWELVMLALGRTQHQ